MGRCSFSRREAELLSLLQADFPLVERPFFELGKRVGLAETDVITSVEAWLRAGLLRRIGLSIDFRRLGYFTTLVAARVDEEFAESVGSFVSGIRWVSHNYLRRHEFNLWFTLTLPERSLIESVLDPVRNQKRVQELLVLPMRKLFKLNVHFDVRTGKGASKRSNQRLRRDKIVLQQEDHALLRSLQRGLPVIPEPFAAVAASLGRSPAEILERLKTLREAGVVRRFGAVLHHHKAGVGGNVMVVWRLPEAEVEAAGRYLASRPEISHAYERVTYPTWPYQLYTMVHARDEQQARDLVHEWQKVVGAEEVQLLVTEKELKKEPVGI